MGLFWEASPVVALPTGSSAFGAITPIYTTKIPWRGFKLCGIVAHSGYTLGVQLYLNGVAWGPVWNIDSSMAVEYDIPVYIPAGVSISAAGYFNTTGNPTGYITLMGKSIGDTVSQVGSSPTTPASIGTQVSAANTWTQLGNSALPNLPIRKLFGFSMSFAASNLFNFDLGFGPSASSVTPLASGLAGGTLNAQYIGHMFSIDTDFLGNGNFLFAQASQASAGIMIYYAY